jgi:hypothetical protein
VVERRTFIDLASPPRNLPRHKTWSPPACLSIDAPTESVQPENVETETDEEELCCEEVSVEEQLPSLDAVPGMVQQMVDVCPEVMRVIIKDTFIHVEAPRKPRRLKTAPAEGCSSGQRASLSETLFEFI